MKKARNSLWELQNSGGRAVKRKERGVGGKEWRQKGWQGEGREKEREVEMEIMSRAKAMCFLTFLHSGMDSSLQGASWYPWCSEAPADCQQGGQSPPGSDSPQC